MTASFPANVAAPNGTLLAEGLHARVIGLGGLLSALFRCLSSRHSRLGKSVLSQYPAESVDPKAVFQEIDADILQHGKRFGGLSIGKEWAIFQEAMLISRIRGIFSDILEPEREHGETAYLLCLVDADGSILEASLPSRSVLDKARACLLESVPDAVSGGFEAMTDFMNMDDEAGGKSTAVRADRPESRFLFPCGPTAFRRRWLRNNRGRASPASSPATCWF
ncbi:MAG: hypothetical protein ACLR0N_07345 [Bilophila wadsworthia]